MTPMREKDRKLRRKQRRVRKLRKLKNRLRQAKDLREREDLVARIRKYQRFYTEESLSY